MKRILAWALALSLLLLAGCGTVVPLQKAETAPQTEQSAPTEPPETEEAPEEPLPAEEPEPTPPPAEAAPEPEPEEPEAELPAPEEEPAEAEELPAEAAPEEDPAHRQDAPEPEEGPAEAEALPAETAPEELPEEAAPEILPETAASPRAVVTVQEETEQYDSVDGKVVLLRVRTVLPRLRLLNAPLRVEAQINDSLQEDLAVLRRSMIGEDGRDRLLAMAEDEAYPYYAEIGQEAYFYGFMESRSVEVPRCDSRILSILYKDFFFSGGAHGSTMLHGISYDLETGKLLRFDELSADPAALRQRCAEYVVTLIREDAMAGMYNPDYAEQIPLLLADPNWYLSAEGLTVFAQEYALGTFALGAPRFTVPYAALTDLLRPELLPVQREETRGRPGISAGETEADFSVSCGEGEGTLTVSAEGTLYDAALEWLDYRWQPDGSFLPVPQEPFWAASRLEDGETLLLRGVENSVLPLVRLRWRTGDGESCAELLGLDRSGRLMTIWDG